MDIKNKEALIAEIEQFKEEALKMHIVQVLADTYERSSLFDHNINADGSVIWFKTQARQLWDFWQAAKAQAVPESNALLSAAMDAVQKLGSGDFVLVQRVITDEWMAVYVDPVVAKYCKDYEDLPFSVEESELPEIRESHRLPIRNAHKRLMQVIEAQEQSHENG